MFLKDKVILLTNAETVITSVDPPCNGVLTSGITSEAELSSDLSFFIFVSSIWFPEGQAHQRMPPRFSATCQKGILFQANGYKDRIDDFCQKTESYGTHENCHLRKLHCSLPNKIHKSYRNGDIDDKAPYKERNEHSSHRYEKCPVHWFSVYSRFYRSLHKQRSQTAIVELSWFIKKIFSIQLWDVCSYLNPSGKTIHNRK